MQSPGRPRDRKMTRSERLVCAALVALAACGTAEEADEASSPPEAWTAAGPDGCNPIAAAWDCLLPYPSDFVRVADASLPSGHRLQVPPSAQPLSSKGVPLDLLANYPADGFSILPQIGVRIPGGLRETDLTGPLADPEATLENTSSTLILDAATGTPVAHLAEIDPRPISIDDRSLVLRPLVPLDHERRYVVVLQGLKHAAGAAVAAPPGFAALRDEDPPASAQARHLTRYFKAHVFPVIERAGVARASVQLAWDFTTGSAAHARDDLLAMRADLLERLAKAPPAAVIDSVVEAPSAIVGRRIEGTVTVPLYLEDDQPGASMVRDGAGRPVALASAEVPFAAIISAAALAQPATHTATVVQVGHGFFGGRGELTSGSVRAQLQQLAAVGFAVDWWGLALNDAGPIVADIAGQTETALRFVDRLHQAMVNSMVVAEAMRTSLRQQEPFKRDGQPITGDGPMRYYGSSLGHILGGTYVALSPHIDRAVLGVGGAGLGMIMPRSVSFGQLLAIFDLRTGDRLETFKALLILQSGFERIDPITWAGLLRRDTLPGSPTEREVLMQIGIGDSSVANMTAHVHARALDIPHLKPAPRPIWGLSAVTAPHGGSALVEFDFGAADPAPTARPPTDANQVHDGVRYVAAAMAQITAFLRSGGQVEQTCAGPCDPN